MDSFVGECTLASLKLIFITDFCKFHYNVFWRRSFCTEKTGYYVSFVDLYIQFLPQVGKFSATTSLNKLSAPFSLSSSFGTPAILIFGFLNESERSYRVSSLFKNFVSPSPSY